MSDLLVGLNIIEFIQHPDVLNDQSLSETQITFLKATYGLALNDREQEIYCRGTGRTVYIPKEQRETTGIAGRRGGKTSKIAAPIVVYEAFRDHGLPPGEQGHAMLLAPTIKQAKLGLHFIANYLRRSKILSKRIRRITEEEIILDNNIVIGCHACSHDSVRGRSIVAVVCDEIGFLPSGEEAASPVEEVLAALRPGTATVQNAKIIKISTPFVKSGLLWEEFSRRNELDFPVWQLTTFEMNPRVKPEDVMADRLLGEEQYRREYLAQFTDSINGWVLPEVLNPCIAWGRHMLPPRPEFTYVAAIDAASRQADFALIVLHKEIDGRVIVDLVRAWTGTKTVPLQFETVLSEIKEILSMYGINWVSGDQYCSDFVSQMFLRLGIVYKLFNFTAFSRTKIFMTLQQLIGQQKIEILEDIELLQQLRSLREEKSNRGQIDVRPSSGKDDMAVALALAADVAITEMPALTFDSVPIDSRPSYAWLGQIPGHCAKESVCLNYPDCLDVGACLGFQPNPSLIQIESGVHRVTMR